MTTKNKRSFDIVGKRVLKSDSLGLACGRPSYTADLVQGAYLVGRIVRSPHAHARIVSINADKSRALASVHAVLTYKDIPRVPYTTAGQGYPEPSPYDTYLLDNKVRFVGDNVAFIAAETEEAAAEAEALLEVEYEPLEAVFDPREACHPEAPVIHDEEDARMPIPVAYDPAKNLASHVEFDIGEVEKGLAEADFVFESEYVTHYGSHCALEPHIAYSYLDAKGRLTIISSTQVPFHARRITAGVLQMPVRQVRVIKPRIGGGFGGKQEVLLEPVVGALTMATGKPVLLSLTRSEVFVSSRTRHPQVVSIRGGVKKDGTITAIDLKVLMNTGAYGAHALTVSCNSGSKVLPLLNKVDNIHFLADSVYTNLPVGGAYRGYGATQSYFALGVLVDEMARKIGMDPCEFYKRHHIREGETSKVFEILGEGRAGVETIIDSCELDACIDRGAEAIGWKHKFGVKRQEGAWNYGVGMVCLMQGSSIPEVDMASAYIKMNEDGSFNLNVGATDLGTGSDTVLAQIAAEVLKVPYEDIIVYSSDTDLTPFDVGAYASSTTYLSGQAVLKTAEKVAAKIINTGAEMLECDPTDVVLEKKKVIDGSSGKSVTYEQIALYSLYHFDQYQIAAEGSSISHKSPPPFAAHFADVAVNMDTGQVKVLEYVAAVDCGVAINPTLAEGQTEGAVINGIGYALTENYYFSDKGRMLNPNFNYYKVFGTMDMPKLKTILVESYEPTGPFGAKSVSEISINGPMPAIANAIYDAIGIRVRNTPFTPERVFQALKKEKNE